MVMVVLAVVMMAVFMMTVAITGVGGIVGVTVTVSRIEMRVTMAGNVSIMMIFQFAPTV